MAVVLVLVAGLALTAHLVLGPNAPGLLERLRILVHGN